MEHNRKWKVLRAKEAEWCAVSILSILFCAHSTDGKGFIKTAPRTVSPRLPLSPWGPWWRKRRQRITTSLPKTREKSHKAWQMRWDMRYILDDRWGQWYQWGPKLPPYPGEWRHGSDSGYTMMEHHIDYLSWQVCSLRVQCLWHWLKNYYWAAIHPLPTIKPRGPFGPCIPAGPVSPGGP